MTSQRRETGAKPPDKGVVARIYKTLELNKISKFQMSKVLIGISTKEPRKGHQVHRWSECKRKPQ